MLKKIGIGGIIGLFVLGFFVSAFGRGWFGNPWGAGEPEGSEVPSPTIEARGNLQKSAASTLGASKTKQILFGDLHVHSTYSLDAFSVALPLSGRDGAHPISEACDFARYCSSLDFWSINDHVFSFTQKQWADTKDSVRQCNAVAGDANNPDVVSFLGWEWTQMGTEPANHYGHKNVIFLETDEDKVPARPIGAESPPDSLQGSALTTSPFRQNLLLSLLAPGGDRQAYFDFAKQMQSSWVRDPCEAGIHVKDLPIDCFENVKTPGELFKKLNEWETPSLVIPHGTTWGFYTPEGSTLDKQLKSDQHDPDRQFLFEIFSGHGSSEEYRPWREVVIAEDGSKSCPDAQANYVPGCHRASEIIFNRCTAAGIEKSECTQRAEETKSNYLAMLGVAGFRAVPHYDVDEWLDAGQCTDCYLPAFNYRPRTSGQYALAITNFDDPQNPARFEFGFLGSSDNHSAKPGTGYKEVNRRENIEFSGRDHENIRNLTTFVESADPKSINRQPGELMTTQMQEYERQSSYFMTGGLIAAHSDGRDRHAIWQAMATKEVYATTGERILLWFDRVVEGDDGAERQPMGSSATTGRTPKFVVRAMGAFKQKEGCPDYATSALTPQRLERLCKGECFNPSDERKLITRIEVIRILPQSFAGEPLDNLIEDAWKTFPCPPDQAGCTIEFEDPEYETLARDATYYVRAVQEPQPTVNGGHLRCTYDEEGRCIAVDVCYSDYRLPLDEDCLIMKEDLAWSSPIFLSYAAEQ